VKDLPKKGGLTYQQSSNWWMFLFKQYIYICILYAYSSMFNSCSNIIFQNVLLGYPFSNSKEWLHDITWHVSVWKLGIPSNGHLLGKMTAKNTGILGCPIFIQTQIWDCWIMLNIYIYTYIIYLYIYIYTYIPFYPCSWMIFPLSLQYSDTMTVVQPSFRDLQSQSNPGAQEHHACERSPWPNTQRDDESSPWIMHGKDCHGFPSSGINQLHQH
jgi:hypothetical protein